MARQQQQQHQDRKLQQQLHAADLLNFHFSTSPPSQTRPSMMASSASTSDGVRRPHPQRRSTDHQQRQHQQQQHRQSKQQQQRSKEDRASARRKPSSAMFYLHSSADHAFVLTRRVKQQSGTSASSYTFAGPDEPVSWEAVRLVKYLAPAAAPVVTTTPSSSDGVLDMTASCPICLDAFTCARITKCGHCFCLPCLLRHVHSHTTQNVYTHVKCPCCGIPLHVDDVRPVLIESVQPPRVGSTMQFVKLHRAKHCHAPYLPVVDQRRHASPHAAPCSTDADAAYTRFNYVDPWAYQEVLVGNERVLQQEVTTLSQQRQRIKGENYHLDMEILFYTMSLDMVQKDLMRARDEAEEEQALMDRYNSASSGIYQPQPVQLMASYVQSQDCSFKTASVNPDTVGSEIFDMDHTEGDEDYVRHRRESVESENAAHEGDEEDDHHDHAEILNTGGHRRYRGDSIGSEPSVDTPTLIRRARSESITSHGSVESDQLKSSSQQQQQQQQQPAQRQHHHSRKLEERTLPELVASMYLDQDATHFYQSTDGQLCFLSRFNMTCLLSDFSTWPPDMPPSNNASTPYQRRKQLPLPDSVEGLVIETETVHLTPDTRKRMPFLSHLPLYTDVCFVELDLHSILSDVTKVKLKAEFEKRRRRRKSKADAQKRADRIAQQKEEARVNELKSRIQRVDPNDEFFRIPVIEPDVPLTGEGFGPALSSTSNVDGRAAANAESNGAADVVVAVSPPKPKTLSFSQIARNSLTSTSPAVPREEFPALGATPAPSTTPKNPRTSSVPPGWNDRIKAAYVANKQEEEEVQAGIEAVSISSPNVGGKKKSKGKKIVLFSTGGQRGGSF